MKTIFGLLSITAGLINFGAATLAHADAAARGWAENPHRQIVRVVTGHAAEKDQEQAFTLCLASGASRCSLLALESLSDYAVDPIDLSRRGQLTCMSFASGDANGTPYDFFYLSSSLAQSMHDVLRNCEGDTSVVAPDNKYYIMNNCRVTYAYCNDAFTFDVSVTDPAATDRVDFTITSER